MRWSSSRWRSSCSATATSPEGDRARRILPPSEPLPRCGNDQRPPRRTNRHMTLSDRTLTLIAMIAMGLSLLAVGFVTLGGAKTGRPPEPLAGDEAVGALLGKIDRLEQAVRALNAVDNRQQVLI